jgi:hypothetical protein
MYCIVGTIGKRRIHRTTVQHVDKEVFLAAVCYIYNIIYIWIYNK